MAEIIAPIVNFLVVVFVLWYYGRKPIAQYLATRSATIAQQIAEGEKQFAEAEKQLSHWETSWKDAKGIAERQMDDAKVTVSHFREKTLSHAAAEAQRIREDAKLVAQSEAVRAKEGVGRELAQRSIQMAGQYLSTHLNEADKHRLVTEYVEKVGNGKT